MSKVYQKIELTANILIIVVAVLLIGLFTQRYFFQNSSASPERKSPTIGNKITSGDFDWSKSSKNVLLVLQKGCKYCSESAEFYKKLIQQSQGKNVKITAVLPQPKEEAEKYLSDLGVAGIETKQSELNSLDVSGTPTIIVTNDKGEISEVWVGKLPPEKESEVIDKITM
jgi:thioredoxin-related protein